MKLIFLTTIVAAFTPCILGQEIIGYPYTWSCKDGNCVKGLATAKDSGNQTSLNVCMLQCSPHAGLWPRPSLMTVHHEVVPIDYYSVSISCGTGGSRKIGEKTSKMVDEISSRFMDMIHKVGKKPEKKRSGRLSLDVLLQIQDHEIVTLRQGTDESYNLTLGQSDDDNLLATITAPTYFGARHGLETLSQLIVYDSLRDSLVVPKEVKIVDQPAYPYRGVLLDTARNYVSVSSLRRLIDALAANKLNTFHWHITDSHSFPFQSHSFPKMSQYGAYSPEKVYTEQDIASLVEFARVRGVRVVPELDAPAHVGEGWQWADEHQATVCFNQEPWQQYCVEPPCGQINPTSDFAYQILEGLYKDMERLFDSDLFHMGGDEVNLNCWNSSQVIKEWMKKNNHTDDENGLYQLWDQFQTKALEKLDSVSKDQHQIVVWTSSLTEKGRVDKYLNNSRYIIQIWTTGKDEIIAELVNKGFQVIFSNYDALYFDCGFGAWVGEGNNWCSPYIGWQKVYENNPLSMLKKLGVDTNKDHIKKLVLGQEATLWTEQADDSVVDQRLWPRAAAMAERLWADPEDSWKAAEHRFLYHRERMVASGIPADTVEPLWCLQNQGHCYL